MVVLHVMTKMQDKGEKGEGGVGGKRRGFRR